MNRSNLKFKSREQLQYFQTYRNYLNFSIKEESDSSRLFCSRLFS